MAVTRIIPLHVGGRRSLAAALKKTVDYVKNPEKTDGGQLVTGYRCNPELAAAEFKMDYDLYQNSTKRRFDPHHSVIAYHLRQSFKPGEISAEEANQIGRELAMRYTHGDHAFLVCTHTDRAHIHNHIIIGAVNLDYTRKLKDVHCSGKVIGKLSDLICLEHGLSVLDHEKCHGGKSYNKWQGYQPQLTHRDRLRYAIDEVLLKGPTSMEELYRLLIAEGYEIKNRNGENPSLRCKGQERFARLDTLGTNYSMAHLRAVVVGTEKHVPSYISTLQMADHAVTAELAPGNMLIDIQMKLKAGKGEGYARWAKNYNIKQTAQTLLFLKELGITDYKQLREQIARASEKCNELRGEAGESISEEYKEARRLYRELIMARDIVDAFMGMDGEKRE